MYIYIYSLLPVYTEREGGREKYLERKEDRDLTLIPGVCMGISLSPSLFLSLSLSHSLSLLSHSIPLIHRFSCAGLRLGVASDRVAIGLVWYGFRV